MHLCRRIPFNLNIPITEALASSIDFVYISFPIIKCRGLAIGIQDSEYRKLTPTGST